VGPKALAKSIAWPLPPALVGVKSRKKEIFNVVSGEDALGGDADHRRFSGLSLCLESRIIAVADAGRAAAALALGKEPATGEIKSHADVVRAHIGPHLAGAGASLKEHADAINAALCARPHVVIFEEGLGSGCEAWIQLFDEVLHGEAIKHFRGAVIACVSSEGPGPSRHGFTERWAGVGPAGEIRQERIVPGKLSISEDALAPRAVAVSSGRKAARASTATDSDADIEALLDEANELAQYCFEEDLFDVASNDGLTVTLLAESMADGTRSLRGFICYKAMGPPRAELHISRLAVPRRHRGRGHAVLLTRWLLGQATRAPRSRTGLVSLGALESAVSFYARLGFVIAPARDAPKEGSDPQTWMELENASVVADTVSALPEDDVLRSIVVSKTASEDGAGLKQGAGLATIDDDAAACNPLVVAQGHKKANKDVERRSKKKGHRKD
jgi:ribosomal protein S18 acetylase RimI-like enzyme